MEGIKIIARKRALEKELKEIQKRERKIYKKLNEIETRCGHAIIIKPIPQKTNKFPFDRTYCLFCGETEPFSRKWIPPELLDKMNNAINIELEDYPSLCTKEKHLESYLIELYCNLVKKFPKLSNKEIANKMKQELREKDKLIK